MGKIEEVRAEMVAAMKNKDKDRKDTLSALLAALKNKAIDKRADLTEAEENEVIKKEIKQTQETKELAPADRTDIIEECEKRLAVLKEFAAGSSPCYGGYPGSERGCSRIRGSACHGGRRNGQGVSVLSCGRGCIPGI